MTRNEPGECKDEATAPFTWSYLNSKGVLLPPLDVVDVIGDLAHRAQSLLQDGEAIVLGVERPDQLLIRNEGGTDRVSVITKHLQTIFSFH